MNSKVLLVRVFLTLTAFMVAVFYMLLKTPGKRVAPAPSLSHALSQPKEEQSSLQEYKPLQATVPGDTVTPTFPLLHVLSQPKVELSPLQEYKAFPGTLPPFPEDLPYPALLKPASSIQKALWTSELYQLLENLNCSISPHVNMVFGDSNHLELVLNWIIAAHVRLNPPLHNIMVLSIDQPLCDFLASKNVPVTCIVVPAESFLADIRNQRYRQGIKTRLLVLRLINFWGYDVASYDSDAILLRNPQHFYDSNPDVQLFAGSVKPRGAIKSWGFRICGGSVIVRSHPTTENLWKAINHGPTGSTEQMLWNRALRNIGIRWNVTTNGSDLCNLQTGWQSYGPLASIVFSQGVFCRKCCPAERSSEYYLIHVNCPHYKLSRKAQQLMDRNSWFLMDNWKDSVNSTLEGNSWLISIYNTSTFQGNVYVHM